MEQITFPEFVTAEKLLLENKAKNYLSKIDLSQLPFDIKLSLVKWDDIEEKLRPPIKADYAIRAASTRPRVESPESIITLFTYCNVTDIKSETNIHTAALQAAFLFCMHELCELTLIAKERKLNPHNNGFTYEFQIRANELYIAATGRGV